MTDSMTKLIDDLKEGKGINTINSLIELGVLNMDTFIGSVLEKADLDCYYHACAIKNVPVNQFIKKIIHYPVTDENMQKKKWNYLAEVFETIPNDLNGEILKAFITDTPDGEYSQTLLSLLSHGYSKYKKDIDVIIGTEDPILIEYSLAGSHYQDERLMSAFIQYGNSTIKYAVKLSDVIIKADTKYTSTLVMRMASLFDEAFLRILLAPKSLNKIEASLEMESNNFTYLKFLNDFLDREITQIKNLQDPINYLKKPTKYHNKYFEYLSHINQELLSEILKDANKIMKKLAEVPGFIATLDENDRFQYLVSLYQKNDFETIRNNRELFKELFEETQGLSRK